MARGRVKVNDFDQFQLRLPPGLRERIKTKADSLEMSMNALIVKTLEREFPPEKSLDSKLEELIGLVAILKQSDSEGPNALIDRLIEELEDALHGIALDKIDTTPIFRKQVRRGFSKWIKEKVEEMRQGDDSTNADDSGSFSF